MVSRTRSNSQPRHKGEDSVRRSSRLLKGYSQAGPGGPAKSTVTKPGANKNTRQKSPARRRQAPVRVLAEECRGNDVAMETVATRLRSRKRPESKFNKEIVDVHPAEPPPRSALPNKQRALQFGTRQGGSFRHFRCSRCPKSYAFETAFKKHLLRHTKDLRSLSFDCNICKRTFIEKVVLRAHKQTVHVKAVNLPRPAHSRLQQSLSDQVAAVHDKAKKFSCPICTKTFDRAYHLKQHTFTHTELRPYACDTCGKSFTLKVNLSTHIRVAHGDEKKFVCQVCGAGFTSKYALQQHSVDHTGERAFECSVCSKQLSSQSSLRQHIRAVHEHRRDYSCTVCNKKFSQFASMKRHEYTHTEERERPFQCDKCKACFTHNVILQNHVNSVHAIDRKFECDQCGKKFKSKEHLKQHELTHKRGKPFQCEICHKFMSTRDVLKTHIRQIHVGDKNHQCEVCGAKFYSSSNLRMHQRTHTGERPFECAICGSRFLQKIALKTHMNSVHITKGSFPCEFCSRKYTCEIYLKDHQRRAHKNRTMSSSPSK